MNDKIHPQDMDDHEISRVVRSVTYIIPAEVDENVTEIILKNREKEHRNSPNFMMWFRLSLTAAAFVLVITAIYIIQMNPTIPQEPAMQISEIKTEMNISEKNIKILWVQKKDFTLIRRHE